MLHGVPDQPEALRQRASQLREVCRHVTDAKALAVLDEAIAELSARAKSLEHADVPGG